MIKLKLPVRSFIKAIKYIIPKRLTLKSSPRIHAWLWWNFFFGIQEDPSR